MNTTEAREITIKELVAAFKGKYANVSPTDYYGVAIEMTRGTIEYEDELKPELYLVSRDSENKVTGSVCISEDAIENIEEYKGTYTINFALNMTSVDISEYRMLEQL